MINKDILIDVIAAYKEYFPTHWEGEKFKWEAIKHFQEHWNINAGDFAKMFEKATEKTYNLLAASYFYPRRMMTFFAGADTEAVRAMFINLFDESKDLFERIEDFQIEAENLRIKHDDGTRKNHYQNTNSISTYLWLRYPDKYYIYKYSEYKDVARELKSDFIPKRSSSALNIVGGKRLYDEVCEVLRQDADLSNMLQALITDKCYPDTKLKTMTIDVGFFISRFYLKDTEWVPEDYSPKLTADEWEQLLKDDKVFNVNSLQIMKRMKDYGGMATCTELATKYGESVGFYNLGSTHLAKRVADKTGCMVMQTEDDSLKWWPVLYVGKYADKDTKGTFIWKLRDELSEALDRVDLSDIRLYAVTDSKDVGYWWLNANPKIWNFSEFDIGEVQDYTLYNDNGNKRRIFQNFLNAKTGDLVIGYESHPVKQVVALAKVTQEQDGKSIYFEKTEGLTVPIDYSDLKNCPELEQMEYFVNPQGSLFKLTKEEYDFIMDIIRENNPVIKSPVEAEKYTKEQFLNEVYMTGEMYDTLTSVLKHKKNIILQGAPGVGKTFAAKRLAYAMMGERDETRIKFIQFHQNYSYEDFIMGFRPKSDGFELKNGIFHEFCQHAANNPNKEYFFIIDEINRGNISKIFGEVLMLIEKDYRGTKTTLAYNGMLFSVPENLYIIGMMNTADRSLAMIDYALRRRFSFFDMEPGFNSDGFKLYQSQFSNEMFDELIERIKELNKEIADDSSLGKGFCIGHSYFCEQKECTESWMRGVVYFDIMPMLNEYWFDEKTRLQSWENKLNGVFND